MGTDAVLLVALAVAIVVNALLIAALPLRARPRLTDPVGDGRPRGDPPAWRPVAAVTVAGLPAPGRRPPALPAVGPTSPADVPRPPAGDPRPPADQPTSPAAFVIPAADDLTTARAIEAFVAGVPPEPVAGVRPEPVAGPPPTLALPGSSPDTPSGTNPRTSPIGRQKGDGRGRIREWGLDPRTPWPPATPPAEPADPSTGAPARRDAAEAPARRPMVVVTVALDELGRVADQLGRAAVDEALAQVARSLAAHSRSSDRVAMLGGATFGVVLADADEPSGRAYLGRVRAVCERVLESAGLPTGLSVDVTLAADADLQTGRRRDRRRPAHDEATGSLRATRPMRPTR